MAKKSPPKTKPKAQLKAAPIVPQDEFIVTVRIENSVYQGTGATALEALQSVPAPTLDLISAGSVRIEHGDKHKEMFYATMPMKRLLNPYNMEVLINDLALGLQMLDLSKDVSKVHHKGQPLDIGIVKYKHKRSNKMIIEISKQNASYHGKKWSEMTDVEQDNLEDLLYLTNIQEADVRFLYV